MSRHIHTVDYKDEGYVRAIVMKYSLNFHLAGVGIARSDEEQNTHYEFASKRALEVLEMLLEMRPPIEVGTYGFKGHGVLI